MEINKENYKLYLVAGNMLTEGSLVGDFMKKDDDKFVCEIIIDSKKVEDAGSQSCITTKFPNKYVIYIMLGMFASLKQDDAMSTMDLYRELGHIELGHLEDDYLKIADSEGNIDDSEELYFKDELEADKFAAELLGYEKCIDALKETLKIRGKVDREMGLNGYPSSVKAMRNYRKRIAALEEA